jgi:hypothetical protein
MPYQHPRRTAARGRAAATASALGLAIAASSMLAGCGTSAPADDGPTRTEPREVQGVHAVDLRTSGDLTVTTGPSPKLTITAGRTALRYLTSTVHDGTVILGSRPGHDISSDIHYELTLPTLDGVVIAGSGSAQGTLVADDSFTLISSGSGSAVFDGLAATVVTVQLSGSGDIDLTGTTDAQSVALDGSGSYLGSQLTSRTSDVRIAGSGNARVHAASQLTAVVTGSGSIRYTGDPTLSTRLTGNGTVSAG